jgi:hypothetical protein
MQEFLLFADQPAGAVIAVAVEFFEARALTIIHRTPYSASFAAGGAGVAGPAVGHAGTAGTEVGRHSAGNEFLPAGTSQVAAVPIQRRPEWCRVWVHVNDVGAVAAAVAAYVECGRERSRRVGLAVQELERAIYSDAQWPAHEATLRASLLRGGAASEDIDARIAAFKRRWDALGRKAAAAPPEQRPTGI